MTGKGKDRDQDQEPPPPELSFVHLLQPNNRDLAANWAVDVGRELDNYLAQLSVTALFQDGTSSLNFAQETELFPGPSLIFYIRGKEIWFKIGAEDLRKHLNLEPFIKVDNTKERPEEDEIQQRAVVNEDCPQCNHPQLEYYTRQLRSADEGQTVFYECPNCHHKFAQNT